MALVKSKGDLYMEVEDDNWVGLKKVEAKDVKEASHLWKGKRIPMAKVEQVLAFFEWSFKETHGETMVHWYFHPIHGWEPVVPPQRGYTGMTVKAFEDHALSGAEEMVKRLPGGWEPGTPWDEKYNVRWMRMGHWHHHCQGSAFQSGTDKESEVPEEGLHITVGGISTGKYSIHARATYGMTIMDANLADWFELEDVVKQLVPVDLHAEIIKRRLATPPKEGTEFPEWWKANVIRDTAPTTGGCYAVSLNGIPQGIGEFTKDPKTGYWHRKSASPPSAVVHRRWNNDFRYYEKLDTSTNEWVRDWNASPYVHNGGAAQVQPVKLSYEELLQRRLNAFEYDLQETMQLHQVDHGQVLQAIEDVQKEPFTSEVVDLLIDNEVSLIEAAEYLEAMTTKDETDIQVADEAAKDAEAKELTAKEVEDYWDMMRESRFESD